jgi:hypothetical protein
MPFGSKERCDKAFLSGFTKRVFEFVISQLRHKRISKSCELKNIYMKITLELKDCLASLRRTIINNPFSNHK